MLETLIETIRSAQAAIERARTASAATQRVIGAARDTRLRSTRLRAAAALLHARYNRSR